MLRIQILKVKVPALERVNSPLCQRLSDRDVVVVFDLLGHQPLILISLGLVQEDTVRGSYRRGSGHDPFLLLPYHGEWSGFLVSTCGSGRIRDQGRLSSPSSLINRSARFHARPTG